MASKKKKVEDICESIKEVWSNDEIILHIATYRRPKGEKLSYEGMICFILGRDQTDIIVEGSRKDTFESAVESAFECFNSEMLRIYIASQIDSKKVLNEMTIEEVIT